MPIHFYACSVLIVNYFSSYTLADKTQRDLIKARPRCLKRNSNIANAAMGGIVRNVVGVGIKPQGRTPSEDLNQEIEALWAEWTKPDNCDVTGQQSFYEMESMLLRRQNYDGEIFVKKVFDRRAATTTSICARCSAGRRSR